MPDNTFGDCFGGYYECTMRSDCKRQSECRYRNNERDGKCDCDMKRNCHPGRQHATVLFGKTKATCWAYGEYRKMEG